MTSENNHTTENPASESSVPGFQSLAEGLTPHNDGWTAPIPEGWKQGRTTYGGLSAALALEAVYRNHKDLPPLRSANINFVGPVTENPIFRTELLRKGRNVTAIEAKAYVGDEVALAISFAFGAGRESDLKVDCPVPIAPTPDECELFTPEFARPMVPAFFHNFDTRLIEGARPMSGAETGYIRTWSRHHDSQSREGMASLLCIADVLPPAALPLFKRMGPVSSMTWIFNVLSDNPRTDDGWWHIETDLTAARNGYSSQIMRIWSTRGELVVEGVQSVAIFI
jgi:acyl-CoA thioesterase